MYAQARVAEREQRLRRNAKPCWGGKHTRKFYRSAPFSASLIARVLYVYEPKGSPPLDGNILEVIPKEYN